jgi:hypothetical protein
MSAACVLACVLMAACLLLGWFGFAQFIATTVVLDRHFLRYAY